MDERRAGQDYADVVDEERGRLQNIFTADHLQPSHDEIEESRVRAQEFLQGGNLSMIVPVKENRPVGESLFANVTQLLPRQYITVMDGGSAVCALEATYRYGIRVLSVNTILDVVDWDRLLPILRLDAKPYGINGANGKGVAILAGYLLQYAVARYGNFLPRWICQHDIELAEYEKYRGVEYLLYGLFQRPLAQYIKMAQGGRENERCMAMRSWLGDIATLPYITPAIRKHADDLFEKLTADKWMLTGEFMVSWNIAMNRPFATGFLEETLITLFNASSVRVSNPNPRSDGKNPQEKESKMQQEIINFISAVTFGEHRVDAWSIDDIAGFNEDVLSRHLRMGWIDPEDLGPVKSAVFRQNRIIPSIKMLAEGSFVDETKLEELSYAWGQR